MAKSAVCTLAVALLAAVSTLTQAGHTTLSCGDCHVIHVTSGSQSRWNTANTDDGLPTFTLYSSAAFDALGTDIGQPDGTSKLCLGCHDGSYPTLKADPDSPLVFRPEDLANTHPISFTYDSALAARGQSQGLKDPATTMSGLGGTIAQDLLDENSKMQCPSCHDVHASGKGDSMLRWDYDPDTGTDKIMCRTCHDR